MTIERTDPPLTGSERELLTTFLDFHRATLATKCQELTGDQLRCQADPPSTLSLLGLLRHLAEVERQWFRRVLAAEPAHFLWGTDGDFQAPFRDASAADPALALAVWHAECQSSRDLTAAAASLDVTGRNSRGEEFSLRWILIHMIEEYARHNGHADLLREHLDGTTGE